MPDKRGPDYSISTIDVKPHPTFLVELAENINPMLPRLECIDLLKDAARLSDTRLTFEELIGCCFRATTWDRIKVVRSTGIDVQPTDATIYVGDLDKALEYGGWPKVVMALYPNRLQSTFRELSVATPSEQLDELQRVFRTAVPSSDGSRIWLSRLNADDPRIMTDYEVAYARWIPGDASAALAAVFVFVHPLRPESRHAFELRHVQ